VSAAKDIVEEKPGGKPEVKATDANDKQPGKNESAASPSPGSGADSKTPAKPAPTGKRPLGTKEIIPFEWKLVGDSPDAALTLFKAVERDDVEVQYERVKQEGYYKNLRIMDVKAKVEQPKPKKPVRPPSVKKAKKSAPAPKTKKTITKTKKTTVKKRRAPAAKKAATRTAPKKTTARATAKKSVKKSVKKSTTKKKTATKSTKKKTAKKK